MQTQKEEIYYQSLTFIKTNRYEIQQNAIYLDFGREEIFNYLHNYKTLNIHYRTALSRNIQSIRQICKDYECYPAFLIEMAQDCEEIRMELIDFLYQLYLRQSSEVNYDMECIEPLKELIKRAHLQVAIGFLRLLAKIIHRTSLKQRKETVNLVLELETNASEENKIIAIQLIGKLAPDLPHLQVQEHFTNHYVTMYNTQSIRIKREILTNLPALATGVDSQFLDRQIIEKFYLLKCIENTFSIRKACVQIIPALMTLSKSKKQSLSVMLYNFTMDNHQSVRTAAFKMLPQFLANCPPDNAVGKLVNIYVGLLDNDINRFVNRENQIIQKVGFYFPGIVQTYGAAKWNVFKNLFHRLLRVNCDEVKLSIAASIHEICKIIGPSIAKDFMFEAIVRLLRQPSELMKQIAVSHLSDFVQVFPNQTRQNFIDVFLVFQNDPKYWRTRYKIAMQLGHLAQIYEMEAVARYIFPITLKLCNDIASEVRLEAASHMYDVINKLDESEQYQSMALLTIKELGSSNRYIVRQMFAYMVRFIYKLRLFCQLLMEMVLHLAVDKVSVVRLTLTVSIEHLINGDLQSHQMFQKAIDILKKDDDEDIAEHFL